MKASDEKMLENDFYIGFAESIRMKASDEKNRALLFKWQAIYMYQGSTYPTVRRPGASKTVNQGRHADLNTIFSKFYIICFEKCQSLRASLS